jgi:hypothetical protein
MGHSLKGFSPSVGGTGFKLFITVKELQYSNAQLPIEVTDAGISIAVKFDPWKALSPIEVTVVGISIAVM